MRRSVPLVLVGLISLSLLLAWGDGSLQGVQGWWSYAIVLSVGAGLMWGMYRWIVREAHPRWLLAAMIVAFLLRLGTGVLLKHLLPVIGYDTEIQRAGHIFRDSFKRDEQAWTLASSEEPLLEAFTDPARSDQYGGLLYISAALYRVAAAREHIPILTVTVTALISSLAVLFGWAFAESRFGTPVAKIAVWLMALFPDAVLLGASQMRESFLIAGLSAVFLGYQWMRDGTLRRGSILVSAALLLLVLPFSPPTALIAVLIAALAWLWDGKWQGVRNWLWFIPIGLIGLAGLLVAGRAWGGIGDLEGSLIQVVLDWISNAGADWRLNELIAESGWIDTIFERTPEWSHLPLVVGYGLVQPFLPAALTSPGAAVWQVIGIYRSLGWFILLPFLLYAPFAAFRRYGFRSFQSYLALLVWGSALLASYRAPGSLWDNPRYRTVFLVVHAVAAAWAWNHARSSKDAWLGRIGILVAGVTLLFTHWYAGRYLAIPRLSFSLTVLASMLFSLVFLIGALVWDRQSARKISG